MSGENPTAAHLIEKKITLLTCMFFQVREVENTKVALKLIHGRKNKTTVSFTHNFNNIPY